MIEPGGIVIGSTIAQPIISRNGLTPQQVGEHDSGNDEDMFGAVIEAGYGQVVHRDCTFPPRGSQTLLNRNMGHEFTFLI